MVEAVHDLQDQENKRMLAIIVIRQVQVQENSAYVDYQSWRTFPFPTFTSYRLTSEKHS
jgi:hypothetical protein